MKRIFFLLLFVGIVFSCDKQYYTTIPEVPVNFSLNLATQDSKLMAKLAFEVFTQPRVALDQLGYGGILVINGLGGNQVDLFAYDLACPVEAKRTVQVVPDKSGITATCPKCGAVFNIEDGTGIPQSVTKYRLKSYKVVGSGTQYTVFN